MKLAAHITFFYVEERILYLEKVIDGLLTMNCDTFIFIYTNKKLSLKKREHSNIQQLIFPYTAKSPNFHFNSLIGRMGWKQWVHPYHLSWEPRKVIEKTAEEFDVQLYLEDDIAFTQKNLDYWLNHKDSLIKNGHNLGFLRVEINKEIRLITDLQSPLQETLTIDQTTYLVNDSNPYCGFWIYDKKELKRFIKTKEWKFKFEEYFVREKSAIGWHGTGMNRYKSTLLPLVKKENNLQTEEGAAIHHLPNNYIGHPVFCKVRFPIALPISN
ncbi:MAG: hypothetical protein CMO34_06630 [Verrucomicrobia bacterium]|nr:hypothetical protein [Verrucomicrobiota bacterium]|tara:strand:- start:2217 stop:3026 length:810 start_codon:yes stop_codon:yes gene_type:complete